MVGKFLLEFMETKESIILCRCKDFPSLRVLAEMFQCLILSEQETISIMVGEGVPTKSMATSNESLIILSYSNEGMC